jgi:predicted nucleotidyltransferase
MQQIGLTASEIDSICTVFRRLPDVAAAILYGSRASGTHRSESDIDIAILGIPDDLRAETIAEELDELPLPYRFDVKAYDVITYAPLREHIDRVGITLYRQQEDIDSQSSCGAAIDEE